MERRRLTEEAAREEGADNSNNVVTNSKPSTNGKPKRSDRNKAGRFVKGHPGGPGNPFAAQAHDYKKAMRQAIGVEEMRQVIKSMFINAVMGDTKAGALLMQYGLGKPKEAEDGILDNDPQPDERFL